MSDPTMRQKMRRHYRQLRTLDRLNSGAQPLWRWDGDGANSYGGSWAQWLEWAMDVRRSRGKAAMHAHRLQVARQLRERAGRLP